MRYPLVICMRRTLVPVGPEFWDGIGTLDPEGRRLEVAVTARGTAEFHWMLDADGQLHTLASTGVMPRSGLMQQLRLTRQREGYAIASRAISVSELAALVQPLTDEDPGCPNVEDLREMLAREPQGMRIDAVLMRKYLGEG